MYRPWFDLIKKEHAMMQKNSKGRWGRRLLGAVLAVPMALAGMALAPAAAMGADATVPTDHLVAAYDFTTKPADGKTVENTAGDADAFGAAVVQNAKDALWSEDGGYLTLSGGSKTSGSWVRLPDDLLAGKDSATVQVEVKADSAMMKDYHFLWSIGTESANETSGEYLFTALKCADWRTPLVGLKAEGKETLVQSGSCVASADRWLSVTATIEGNDAKLYIDGTQVASGTTAHTLSEVEQSFNTIGRSPWPDNNFKGQVANFRVYDTALTADQIGAISTADAALHLADLAGFDTFDMPDEINDAYVALPSADGLTWTSSDPNVITAEGMVNQPAKGEAAKQVTLTATANVRGLTATRDFTVTVNPTTKDARQLLDEAAAGYAIPSVLRSGDAIPAAAHGTNVTVTSTKGVTVTDGVVTIEDDADNAADNTAEAKTGEITIELSKDGVAGTVEKTFAVKVLPTSASTVIAAYDRNATGVDDANNGDIAYSMHLASRADDTGAYTPYNENYGIFFALGYKSQPLNMNTEDVARSLKDPSLFRMKDGTFGVIAVRTNRGSLTGDSTAKTSVLVATSKDLLTYHEQADSASIVDLGETNGVNAPYAVYDTAAGRYIVGWSDDNGIRKHTTFDTLDGKNAKHGDVIIGDYATAGALDAADAQGIADYRSGRTIAIEQDIAEGLDVRFGRSTNTGAANLNDITVKEGATLEDVTDQLPDDVELTYSDGSTGSLPITAWNTDGLDLTKAGEYTITGTVKQTDYQIPFAEDRADPSIYKWQWTHEVDGKETTETKFLMIATNDIQGDCTWQHNSPHMPFRMADSIEALADEPGNADATIDANGYNAKEVSLLTKGAKDSEGNAIQHSFWAPEIHEINGRLTVLFMAGYGNQWTNGKSVYMQLKQDAEGHDLDPTDPANWETPTPIYRNAASMVNGKKDLALDANGNVGMSLDMTYFQDTDGNSYYAWQQLGATYIATMDPSDPGLITSKPVRIVSPEYAWNVTIAEGPNVTMRDGKLYMMFSGSSVGKTYTTGLAVADASGSDLTDPASWTVLNYPIQKSGPFNGEMQLGTGHGMWSEDEDGNQIYVFHAYATQHLGSFTNATGRDTFVRRVHWAADGMPVFDMSLDEELSDALKTVSVKVAVTADEQPEPEPEPDKPDNPDKPTDPDQPGGDGDDGKDDGKGDGTSDGKGDGSSDGDKSDGKSDGAASGKPTRKPALSRTGSAVLGVGGAMTALALAGISLTLTRRRRA